MHSAIRKLKFTALALSLSVAVFNTSQAAGVLKIGTDGGAEPWTFTSAAGDVMGFDIDVGNEVCKRIEVECEWIVTDWNGIFPALDLGKFDMIMAGVSETEERKKSMDFTRSYALSLVAFAAKEGAGAGSYNSSLDVINLDDLNAEAQAELDKMKTALGGMSVGIQSGANSIGFIEEYFGDMEMREYEKLETRDLDMQAERIHLGMGGTSYWDKVKKKEEVDITSFGPKFGGGILGGGIAAPIKKGNADLKAKVDAALDSMIADGTMSKLAVKWLGSDASPKK